jgi:hypothetical protein
MKQENTSASSCYSILRLGLWQACNGQEVDRRAWDKFEVFCACLKSYHYCVCFGLLNTANVSLKEETEGRTGITICQDRRRAFFCYSPLLLPRNSSFVGFPT